MKRLVRYSQTTRPRACVDPGDRWCDDADDWTYDAGSAGNVEVHEQVEGEDWEDTGLLDRHGEPIYRLTRYVRRPIGFVVVDDE